MLEEKGIVVALDGTKVSVQTQIKTTCSSCSAQDGCGTGTIAKALSPKANIIVLQSELNLNVGDTLVLGVEEGLVVKSALYVYILPIIGFILFAIVAELLYQPTSRPEELLQAVLAFVGGWLGLVLARKRLNRPGCEQNQGISILRIESDSIPIRLK